MPDISIYLQGEVIYVADQKKKEKTRKSGLSEIFERPVTGLRAATHVGITAGRSVLIENHGGILSYGESEIVVNGGQLIIRIRGDGLTLQFMNADELTVKGHILAVEFEY
jgi:sporulation protein YqfC